MPFEQSQDETKKHFENEKTRKNEKDMLRKFLERQGVERVPMPQGQQEMATIWTFSNFVGEQ